MEYSLVHGEFISYEIATLFPSENYDSIGWVMETRDSASALYRARPEGRCLRKDELQLVRISSLSNNFLPRFEIA
jgi:hypothetical protein